MENEKYRSTIGFIDMLFNILVGFAFLFIVAFILIKPEAKKKDFDRRAEFIIIMEWDDGANDDVDLHVEDPLKGLANFRYPRVNFMHLDKDDLGSKNDTTYFHDGSTKTIPINREVMTIRGIMSGQWTINGHYYSNHDYRSQNDKSYFITVRVELHRVNPYEIMWIGEKKFTHKGQEETFLRFTLDNEGNLVGPFDFRKKEFVKPKNMGSHSISSSLAPSYVSAEDYETEDGVGVYEPDTPIGIAP